ncbi:MAG: hypothetical protein K8F52_12755 [Candidatus Scalindua rubra]|uniref:Uncharacterized protein n=1 Tax=Candidatus Scalindua brodae TaxID=237368 RepID=A0A0B0EC17_9BACT|nr:MAG: hypothetical protein SCABRO_04037 [Candidatus Scalindua brodae]MBZ0109529.1 hypothetical protein [Candidatus Scalindua rubra]TWU33461.1 hypothetical protein S225a_13480 [Candidatus Brocadiaceae bacterium S225]
MVKADFIIRKNEDYRREEFARRQKARNSGIQNGKQQLNSAQLRGQLFLRMYGNDFTAADRKRIINKISDIQLYVDT